MALADQESKASNCYKAEHELESLIEEMDENNLHLKTVAEARDVIKKLVSTITGNKFTQIHLETVAKKLQQ